ncbi:MAG TPA: cytochrome c biogenesis protein CcdA, partial [Spirochaetota bacterium]|nr:cytochrome c biogenesis protein CcdA [Spirochaetota bacterium]
YNEEDSFIKVQLDIDSKGYIYANPKGPGTGKAIQISLQHDLTPVSTLLYSQPSVKYQPAVGEWVNIYRDQARFYILVPEILKKEDNTLSITVDALFCDDISCTPFSKTVTTTLNMGEDSRIADNSIPPDFTQSDIPQDPDTNESVTTDKPSSLIPQIDKPWFIERSSVTTVLGAIITGLLAGLFLNIMPCVLPVISLKLMYLIKNSGKSRSMIITNSIFYSLGIIFTFVILASLAAFAGHNWGSLFQNTAFIRVMIVIIFTMALSLFGVFTFSTPPILSSLSGKFSGNITSALFNGFLATVLATPCSGPFLGATLAWTLTQPPLIIYAVFLSIGTGLALPFFVLTLFPKLISYIPKSGSWSLYSERLFGFILAASAVYFLSILESRALIGTLILIWFVSIGLWQLGQFATPVSSKKSRTISYIILLFLVLAGYRLSVYYSKPVNSSIGTIDYSHSLLNELNNNETIVAVKFTADWCSNCKYVEMTVFNKDSVKQEFEKKGLSLLKADITAQGTQAEELLSALGSRSIPFLALFYPGEGRQNPLCLDDIYSENDLLKIIEIATRQADTQNNSEKEEKADKPEKIEALTEIAP